MSYTTVTLLFDKNAKKKKVNNMMVNTLIFVKYKITESKFDRDANLATFHIDVDMPSMTRSFLLYIFLKGMLLLLLKYMPAGFLHQCDFTILKISSNGVSNTVVEKSVYYNLLNFMEKFQDAISSDERKKRTITGK